MDIHLEPGDVLNSEYYYMNSIIKQKFKQLACSLSFFDKNELVNIVTDHQFIEYDKNHIFH